VRNLYLAFALMAITNQPMALVMWNSVWRGAIKDNYNLSIIRFSMLKIIITTTLQIDVYVYQMSRSRNIAVEITQK